MAEESQQEVAVDLPGGTKFKVRGSDILGVGTMMVVCLLAYVLWEHKGDSHENGKNLTVAIREMTAAQTEGVRAQRVMNCLLATAQDKREAALTTCERIAR